MFHFTRNSPLHSAAHVSLNFKYFTYIQNHANTRIRKKKLTYCNEITQNRVSVFFPLILFMKKDLILVILIVHFVHF